MFLEDAEGRSGAATPTAQMTSSAVCALMTLVFVLDASPAGLHRFTLQSRFRALVSAADHYRLEVIDRLAAAGTAVNEPDAECWRLPLHTAAGHGRVASVRRSATRPAPNRPGSGVRPPSRSAI